MKTVLQRVQRAEVRVDGEVIGTIAKGVLLLVAVERGDGPADARITARKIANLRIFPDKTPMDQSLLEIGGACLVVSQFTIAGSIKKGRRPSFDQAAEPALAETLYEAVVDELRSHDLPVETGRFGATMEVELVNDGPVTLLVMSKGGVLL